MLLVVDISTQNSLTLLLFIGGSFWRSQHDKFISLLIPKRHRLRYSDNHCCFSKLVRRESQIRLQLSAASPINWPQPKVIKQ